MSSTRYTSGPLVIWGSSVHLDGRTGLVVGVRWGSSGGRVLAILWGASASLEEWDMLSLLRAGAVLGDQLVEGRGPC
jgi:hypothetical protein